MMETTTVIPKDKSKSYQLWQWDTLNVPESDSSPAHQTPKAPVEDQQMDGSNRNDTTDKEKNTGVSEEEIAAIVQQAKQDGQKQGHAEGLNKGYQEGYGKGYQEGHSNGLREGRQQGETEIKAELVQIKAVFENLDEQLQTLDQHVAQDLLTFAIDLTKKMITQALIIHPELILPVVQDAVRQLPVTMQHARLFLHPEDAKIVRQHLIEHISQDHWEICEDDQITQGGCRIEASGSEIDASVETRWRRALAAIGQKNDWIER